MKQLYCVKFDYRYKFDHPSLGLSSSVREVIAGDAEEAIKIFKKFMLSKEKLNAVQNIQEVAWIRQLDPINPEALTNA